jgi:hypothetical protein
VRDGDHPCPGSYVDKTLVYTGVSDTRACDACTCGAVANPSCAGQIAVFSNAGCQGGPLASVVANGSDCDAPGRGAVNNGSYMLMVQGNGTACSPSGGAPQGEATPTGAITVCCLP